MSTVFSFRAECRNDVGVFLRSLMASGVSVSYSHIVDILFPDVAVEIVTSEASVEQLIQAARKIDDLHVIEQTLRPAPLADNSLERDYHLAA